jgi:hypothetical protein
MAQRCNTAILAADRDSCNHSGSLSPAVDGIFTVFRTFKIHCPLSRGHPFGCPLFIYYNFVTVTKKSVFLLRKNKLKKH